MLSTLRAVRKTLLVATTATVLLLAAAGADAQERAPAVPALDQRAALATSQSVMGEQVGEHSLTDSNGRRFSLADFRGKPLLVNFVYTACYHVCPTTTRFLRTAVKSARDALGPGTFHTLTIGFNLPYDSPQAMKAFARQQGIDQPDWTFASPDAADVDRLLREFGFSYAQTPNGFDHVLQVTMVDAEGKVYQQLYGESFDLPLLVAPLKALLTGVPIEKPGLGAWLDRVKLLCTVYDPAAGRYRVNYAVVIEIFVGASILVVGIGSLALEWRRHRRARRAA